MKRCVLVINGLTTDSRQVLPGYLFAALVGCEQDGRTYIDEALARGAVAILALPGTHLEASGVLLVEDQNPRQRFTEMVAAFYSYQPCVVVAVTGTNGKTSVASFVQQIWSKLGFSAGSVGTLGVIAPGIKNQNVLTTPDPVILHAILASLANHNITHVVLEASSHGLDQLRLDGVRLAAAALTNLTHDHLDYHGTMEAYRAAKMRLFTELLPPGAPVVLNADTSVFAAFSEAALSRRVQVFSYGIHGKDVRLVEIMSTGTGNRLDLCVQNRRFNVQVPMIGSFQVMNALCALGIVTALGAEVDTAVAALETLSVVPGRLQWVAQLYNGATIYVDYAHTPDALESVLTAIRPHVCGRLLVVFGCGGGRDRSKRPQMGAIAKRLADVVIVTDDNPRNEVPSAIRDEIISACPTARNIGDRATAISTAVATLQQGDVLVVAGKGHEQGQIIGDVVVPFDDVVVCQEAVALADITAVTIL